MKGYITLALLLLIIGINIGALDTGSSQFIDRLIAIDRPQAPEIMEDGVLFTFSDTFRSVGIAFAHEQFTRVHWFEKLMIFEDRGPPPRSGKMPLPRYSDPKVLFFAYTPPAEIRNLEYRLIINGLWTADPLNPLRQVNQDSGLIHSVVVMPEIPRVPAVSGEGGPKGALQFTYAAPPGETVTVAGDFNGWDPFMYELRETAPGRYTLTLPLPPGTYHYLYFHRGERRRDPNNPRAVYDQRGDPISVAAVE
jgi:hypothetical protein